MKYTTVFLLLLSLSAFAAEKPVLVKDVTLLGMKLRVMNTDQVREQMRLLGGFLEARTTVRQFNVDIFYPWSRKRDVYKLEFHYDPNGRFQWAEQLYRYSPHKQILTHNKMTPITTEEVVQQLQQQLGPPQTKQWRSCCGTPGYFRYEWQDDTMTVVVDRVDGDPLKPVFVLYRLNTFNYQYVENVNAKRP